MASNLDIPVARVFLPLLPPMRYKGAKGGRGSGKSYFFADLMIERSIVEKTNSVCIREVQKNLRESVKRLIEDRINILGVGHLFTVMSDRIKCPHGGIIIFTGMSDITNEGIKSLEGFDVAWYEEAQRMSERSLKLLRPTIRKSGSELWFSWNPEKKTDPIEMFLCGDNPPPDSVVVTANWQDNPNLPGELYNEMLLDRATNTDYYMHVWEGAYWNRSEARVFNNWSISEFEAEPGDQFYFGADWGFSTDPTALVRCFVRGRALYIDHEAYMYGCEISQLPAMFDTVPESRQWFITADSSRPETISHMRANGFPRIRPSIKGAGSVVEGVAFLQAYNIIVHPRCANVINELDKYSYRVDKLTDKVTPVLLDKFNHAIDAIRYALEDVMRADKIKRNAASATITPPITLNFY